MDPLKLEEKPIRYIDYSTGAAFQYPNQFGWQCKSAYFLRLGTETSVLLIY